jgi:hypothetical protein
MNRSTTGWVVAAVLAVALIGVIVFAVAGDEGGRPGALLPGGTGLPADVTADINRILDEKKTEGTNALPKLQTGQDFRHLDANPRQICDNALPPNVFAEWKNNPKSLDEAKSMANSIIVGTVESVKDGPALVAEAAKEPGSDTPVQTVTIKVNEVVKGTVGDTVNVERLGDAAGCFRVDGEPLYKQGEQYLLLLENGLGGRAAMHTISPSGRFQVIENQLRGVHDSLVLKAIAGQTLDQVKAKLKG